MLDSFFFASFRICFWAFRSLLPSCWLNSMCCYIMPATNVSFVSFSCSHESYSRSIFLCRAAFGSRNVWKSWTERTHKHYLALTPIQWKSSRATFFDMCAISVIRISLYCQLTFPLRLSPPSNECYSAFNPAEWLFMCLCVILLNNVKFNFI